jgi:hypothetical protein
MTHKIISTENYLLIVDDSQITELRKFFKETYFISKLINPYK